MHVGVMRAIRLHSVATGPKILPGQHIFSVQHFDQIVPGEARRGFINLRNHILVIATFGGIVWHHGYPGYAGESIPIGVVIPAVYRYEILNAFQIL